MTGALAIVYNASDANLSALHADQYVKLFLKPFLMNRSWISQSVLLLALVAIGCDSQTEREVSSDGKQKVVLMLNWFPEAEHGGFYAAQAEGIFEKYGLEVEIRPGGPSAPVAQELVAGRVDFAIGNADDVLIFRQQDVPVVALMAPIQDTPRCILVHEASDANSLEELAGLTMQAGGGRPYLTFMQAKGLLDDVKIVPYSGVPKFAESPKNAMQGYNFSEPLLAEQLGVQARVMMVSDIGFNPYASCLIATEDFIQKNPVLVDKMVDACREGWAKYLESPQKTNESILAANEQGMTMEALEFGAEQLRPLCLPDGMPAENVAEMSQQRWQTLVDQFIELKLLDERKCSVQDVFSSRFLEESSPTDSQP